MLSDPVSHLMHDSPLGPLTLSATSTGLTHLYFPGHAPLTTGAAGDGGVLMRSDAQLTEYFAGNRTRFDVSLAPSGTPFQRRVWELLQEIPYGETTTYGRLADRLTAERGKRVEPRALAGAVARTPIPIIIPCHRVIGADGSLRGYGGGLERKRMLLDFEASGGNRAAFGDAWRPRQLALL